MTVPFDDPIDPYEQRLSRRVGTFAGQAVRPVDPLAIAAAAHEGARRNTLTRRLFGSTASMVRLGVVLSGAIVAAAAFGVFINAGGNTTPGPTANAPQATPTEVPVAAEACSAVDLSGQITGWEGAAGSRIATITVRNHSSIACLLPQYMRPALIDADGNALIVGEGVPQPAPIPFPAGSDATSNIQMVNYCGAAPAGALRIRLYLPDEGSVELSADTNLPYTPDPPPCNGPNAGAGINMQPFRLGAGTY